MSDDEHSNIFHWAVPIYIKFKEIDCKQVPIVCVQNNWSLADATPSAITCVQAGYDFAPIATLRQIVGGKEQSAFGSVIFSLKANIAIRSIDDFSRKRVGVGQPFSAESFQLGWQVETDSCVHNDTTLCFLS